MAGGLLESDDFDAFYNTDDFGVAALIDGVPQKGQFRRVQIELGETFAVRPTFRCNQLYANGTAMVIDGVDYVVRTSEELDAGEYRHILTKQ